MPERQGFSLIELLATLAILGLMAAILATAIPAAISRAERLTAASNLRQVGTALPDPLTESHGPPVLRSRRIP